MMQLVYRGITYTAAENTLKPSVNSIMAKFRGQTYSLPRSINLHPQRQHAFIYRGISYTHP